MIFTIEEARDILRIDGSDNDAMIFALLSAVPPYLEATTGYTAVNGDYSPLAQAAGLALHQYGNYSHKAKTNKLQRISRTLWKERLEMSAEAVH